MECVIVRDHAHPSYALHSLGNGMLLAAANIADHRQHILLAAEEVSDLLSDGGHRRFWRALSKDDRLCSQAPCMLKRG